MELHFKSSQTYHLYWRLFIQSACQNLQMQTKPYIFFLFPVENVVCSFLTRVVLYAGKEAWKRRPFLLSSQICCNYRITSICGSLAAFSLPPPPLSSFPLPSFICILPYSSLFCFYSWAFFFWKTTSLAKFMIIRTVWHFPQSAAVQFGIYTSFLPKATKRGHNNTSRLIVPAPNWDKHRDRLYKMAVWWK